MDHAKRGSEALVAGRYADAVQLFTTALASAPTSPDYFIRRSTAHQRASPPNHAAALSDAEQAVIFAQKRAKRELIVQAQLRRAIALVGLERYGDAGFVLAIVKRMDPSEKTLAIWENKISTRMNALAEDDPKRLVTEQDTPVAKQSSKHETQIYATSHPDLAIASAPASTPSIVSVPSLATSTAQTPADKIKHTWYQTSDNVSFTLFAKGVPKDQATVEIQPRSLMISFPLVTGSTYDLSLDPLFGAVDVTNSTFSIMSTKIEVTLRKTQSGQKWQSLEGGDSADAPSTTGLQSVTQTTPVATGPSYPTSSRSGPKNWDKLANDLTSRKPKKDASKTPPNSNPADTSTLASAIATASNADDDDDDEDWDYDKEGGDEANAFFKKLYADASPDVRRAMMKSFTESNGTALSTNWAEVGQGKVQVTPPDGMEAKKWDS